MQLDKVFIGHAKKDGKERCFYKKRLSYYNDYDDIVYYNDYIDLETKEHFIEAQLHMNSLVSFKKIFPKIYQESMFKRKVKKIYQADRDKMIEIRRLFLGSIVKYKSPFRNVGYADILETEEIIEKKDVLFMGTSNGFARDVKFGEDYFIVHDQIEKVAVHEKFIKNVRHISAKEKVLSKREVLKRNYRKEL